MRKIFFSVLIIAGVAALALGGTIAYFSDRETSLGHTFSLGTVEISVNDELRWTKNFSWENFQPGDSAELLLNIKNEGANPLKLWQILKCFLPDENGVIEPEAAWYAEHNDGQPKNDLQTALVYEMYVDGRLAIAKEAGVTMEQIADRYLALVKLDPGANQALDGILAPGASLALRQRFYLPLTVGNWAQSDKLLFTLELEARQAEADAPEPLLQMSFLENKLFTGDWSAIADGRMGILKYDYLAPTFNYQFSGLGLEPDKEYCLLYAEDPWAAKKIFIGQAVSGEEGRLDFAGSADTGSLPFAEDSNYPDGAKIWLVPCADYDFNGQSLGWPPKADWLFDNWPGLINYGQGERPNETITCENEAGGDEPECSAEICSDGLDNDCDGFIDGADSDCLFTVAFSDLGATSQYGYYHDYSQAKASFVYPSVSANPFGGTISASGLKPYATYQLKFEAIPVCRDALNGNDILNETIGYLGRWWNYSSGGNSTDAYYQSGSGDCLAGYLVWAYLTADAAGNASAAVLVDNSYHVLWCGGGICDNNVNSFLTHPDPGHPALNFCPPDKVNGELERFSCAGLSLPAGDYNLKIILNEESFHQGPGSWTAVMAAPINFTIK